jgi:hypothetical protein
VIDRFTDLVPPAPLRSARWWLEPLSPTHNTRDHRAWSDSIDHIRSTPGFAPGDWGTDGWPTPMTLTENLADLEMHEREFTTGEAFAYSVLADVDGEPDVIGCVYVDPDPTGAELIHVRSWVTHRHATLDHELASAVDAWLRDAWRVTSVRWPGRPGLGSGASVDDPTDSGTRRSTPGS